VNAVEVHGMRVITAIDEGNAEPVSLSGPDGWTWYPAIESPSGKEDAGRYLDLFVDTDNRVLAQRLSVIQG